MTSATLPSFWDSYYKAEIILAEFTDFTSFPGSAWGRIGKRILFRKRGVKT